MLRYVACVHLFFCGYPDKIEKRVIEAKCIGGNYLSFAVYGSTHKVVLKQRENMKCNGTYPGNISERAITYI